MTYIYGIDETCKCPVIGSLPVCIAKVKTGFFKRKYVRALPIKDSKLTTLNQRKRVYSRLKGEVNFSIRKIYPHQMNENLIDLEVKEIIQGLRLLNYKDGEKVIIDLFDSNKENLIKRFKRFGFNTDFTKWVIEIKADENHKIVSLASIFSKIYNDDEYEVIRKEYDFGNGSPSHLKTIKFIIDNYDNLPWFVRKNWLTVERLKDPKVMKIIKERLEKKRKKGERYVKDLYKNV